MSKDFYVYVKCRPNGRPFYVGKGVLSRVKSNRRSNAHFYNIVKKYGSSNIKTSIIFKGDEAECLRKEIWFISYFKTLGCKLVNVLPGGEGGAMPAEIIAKSILKRKSRPPTEKELLHRATVGEKVRAAIAKNGGHWSKGTKRTDEYCRKLAKALTGKKRGTCPAISAALKGRVFTEEHKQKLRGQKSEEHKQKLRKPRPRVLSLEEHLKRSVSAKLSWRKRNG